MARVTPAQFTERHARHLKNAIEDMRVGVEGVTVAPTAQAAAKQDKMKAHLVASIDNGTWANRLKAVPLEDWKNKMLSKGLPRVASGIDAASDKVESFAAQLLPAVDAARNKVGGMPDLTLEDSINRMSTYVREMAKFRKK